jgi:hypothetical protein
MLQQKKRAKGTSKFKAIFVAGVGYDDLFSFD